MIDDNTNDFEQRHLTDVYCTTMNSLLARQGPLDSAHHVYGSLPTFLHSSFNDYRCAYQTAARGSVYNMADSVTSSPTHHDNVAPMTRTPSFAIHELLGLHGSSSRHMFPPPGVSTDWCRYGSSSSHTSQFFASTSSHQQGHVTSDGHGNAQSWPTAMPLPSRSSTSNPPPGGVHGVARAADRSATHGGLPDSCIQRFTGPHDSDMTSFSTIKNYNHGYVSQLGK